MDLTADSATLNTGIVPKASLALHHDHDAARRCIPLGDRRPIVALSWEGRVSRRLRKKIKMLFARISRAFSSSTVYVYEAQTARVTSS
jgi:hypothetical protein